MPKKFYSERDIEDLYKQGVRSLDINDQVILTELAYEKARQLGMTLAGEGADKQPSSPFRPYITKPIQSAAPTPQKPAVGAAAFSTPASAPIPSSLDLSQRIRSSVIAKLGDKVDAALIDTIISRVLTSTGLK
jgi:hypothetical protein